jgi:hypothetical protein
LEREAIIPNGPRAGATAKPFSRSREAGVKPRCGMLANPMCHPEQKERGIQMSKPNDENKVLTLEDLDTVRGGTSPYLMAMDRMSKLMDTLSNLLKSISKTGEEITQNLK